MRSPGQTGSAAHAALVAAVALLASLGVLVTLAVTLPLAFQEDEPAGYAAPVTRPATQAEVDAALDEAMVALEADDEDAWRAAFPATGPPARQASADLFETLGGLPWTSLDAVAAPIPSAEGRFEVRFLGDLAGVGPEDRIVADRVLEFGVLGERVVVTGDMTPRNARDQYFMAYRDPRVVEGDAVVVLTEPQYEDLARDLAAAAVEARDDLAKVGVDPDRPVLLYLYASRGQLGDALGGGPSDGRVEFFSAPVERLADELWSPRDVNLLAPALEDEDDWLPRLLAHELTHAFTVEWFADTQNDPVFLAEGLAVAVEGGRSYDPLREEIAGGNQRLPLANAIALGSLWSGNSQEKVHLAYLEAGSVVLYILDTWGLEGLRGWVTAVADTSLAPAAVESATSESLGVSWDEFVAGWSEYVETLP